MHKQSSLHRQERLEKGSCPIHGVGMSQVGGWYWESDPNKRRSLGEQFTVVGCPRQDCGVEVKAYNHDGPFEMLPEWEHILAGESDGDLAPIASKSEKASYTEFPRYEFLETCPFPCPNCQRKLLVWDLIIPETYSPLAECLNCGTLIIAGVVEVVNPSEKDRRRQQYLLAVEARKGA